MGNSASTPANGRQLQRRTQSPSPSPGAPHRSLRTKKRSLELPDLASLALTSTSSQPQKQPKTPSIPIPGQKPNAEQPERGRPKFSSTDLLDQRATTSNQPFPPRGTPYYRQQHQQQIQQRRIQELYNQSHAPASPPPPPEPRQPQRASAPPIVAREVVRSSIPVALDPAARQAPNLGPFARQQPVPTKIVWRGGGYNVVLARAGDDDWKGRRVMERESPGSPVFVTTVDLLPGTHHIRFLVDDQWRVADDLPTAVDDQGSLANYVAVPFPPAGKPKDPSFFVESAPATPPPPQPKTIKDVPNPVQQEQWTNVLPPELLEAFKEEEMYLAANQGQVDPHNHHQRVSGFVPAPNIPPAPTLPRHLDKLILNMRVSPGPAANAIGNTAGPVGNAASVIQSGLNGGVGSGQGGSGRSSRRDRSDRERREERRRGRERGYSDVSGSRRGMQPPPPPPPTEVGEIGPSSADGILADSIPTTINEVPPVEGEQLHETTGEAPTSIQSTATTTPTTSTTPIPSPSIPTSGGTVSSRSITIDTNNMPSLTDDASVLPVPSHVVLHHLCTSAIRNGVLAVASTTRYRKKYLTTIYYKPTA
ncbi:hypothetical protein CC1G_03367 [Coprinopsis cinerea okayama7|uniref:Association with the SNF1 complex (ASC) domain-containing protein n=1 Tax=Coprinopsis cinerea (strain Okayama-7 / 130 / ATCC MYA-4618 / FGSC 9003) TaxID=240176 RepID=A8NQZ6_COPC7|nr:hypothetical protein CC1G_03367 [Coprinopsis cinerea okayama7\|eukprot:XP_001835585.1 hypothetical protein CC1G_03367 [Coprinopsis cinerea okayama7\